MDISKNDLFRHTAHVVFRTRGFVNRRLARFGATLRDSKILELGSGPSPRRSGLGFGRAGGKPVKDRHPYSAKKFFHDSNEFIESDVVPEFGHRIVDATAMDFNEEFDVVLCVSVLEHVFDFKAALVNIRKALKPGGIAIISVPGFYPLHDQPADYWRFTEHSLRRLLSDYAEVKIERMGPQAYPLVYYAEARK